MVEAPALDLGKHRILVIAPHPDDESLGCGGLIALAQRRNLPVRVVFVTDGSGSHRSASITARRLAAIRRREAHHALFLLGVRPCSITWMGMKDRFVPYRGPAMQSAVLRAARLVTAWRPTLLVLPSSRDQHGDHQAAAAIWRRAAARIPTLRLIDYLIWPAKGHNGEPALTLDVAAVRYLKQRAIQAHRSQRGFVIRDDPRGFVLPRALLLRARRPVENYAETRPG